MHEVRDDMAVTIEKHFMHRNINVVMGIPWLRDRASNWVPKGSTAMSRKPPFPTPPEGHTDKSCCSQCQCYDQSLSVEES
jgi:hypothetical protein